MQEEQNEFRKYIKNLNNEFEIDNSKVVFYGICKDCKGK